MATLNQQALDTLNRLPNMFADQFLIITTQYLNFISKDEATINDRTEFINTCYNATNMINKLIAIASNGHSVESQVYVGHHSRVVTDKVTDESEGTSNEAETDNTAAANDANATENTVEETTTTTVSNGNDDYYVQNEAKAVDTTKPSKKKKSSTKKTRTKKTTKKTKEPELTAADVILTETTNWGLDANSFGYKLLNSISEFTPVGSNITYNDFINRAAEYFGKTPNVVSAAIYSAINKADFSKTTYIPLFKKINKSDLSKQQFIQELLDFFK